MTEFMKRRHIHTHIHSETHSYRHKLSTGADKLSEAEQEVLFSGENLGQLARERTEKCKEWEHKIVGWYAGRGKMETLELFVCLTQMGNSDINNRKTETQNWASPHFEWYWKIMFLDVQTKSLHLIFAPTIESKTYWKIFQSRWCITDNTLIIKSSYCISFKSPNKNGETEW